MSAIFRARWLSSARGKDAPATRRLPLLGVLALCVLTQFSSLAHMLLVTHSTCPEHGELVHPSEHSSTSGAHVHGDIARGATVRGDGSSSESHEDDHCSVLGDGRQRALSVATSLPAACVAAPAVAVSLPRSSTHVSSIALYMIAPKSSPPA